MNTYTYNKRSYNYIYFTDVTYPELVTWVCKYNETPNETIFNNIKRIFFSMFAETYNTHNMKSISDMIRLVMSSDIVNSIDSLPNVHCTKYADDLLKCCTCLFYPTKYGKITYDIVMDFLNPCINNHPDDVLISIFNGRLRNMLCKNEIIINLKKPTR